MKRLILATVGALLVFTLLSCGTTNRLQTITLSVSQQNGQPVTMGGTFSLVGKGGTLHLKATGNYSNRKTFDLTNKATYTMIVDPNNKLDAFGTPLPAPPETAQIDVTGMVTAVNPPTCTWVDVSPTVGSPVWNISGNYVVTASFQGIASQPVYIPVASAPGSPDYPNGSGNNNNPTLECGPSSSGE